MKSLVCRVCQKAFSKAEHLRVPSFCFISYPLPIVGKWLTAAIRDMSVAVSIAVMDTVPATASLIVVCRLPKPETGAGSLTSNVMLVKTLGRNHSSARNAADHLLVKMP